MPEAQLASRSLRQPSHAGLAAVIVYTLAVLLVFHQTTWSMVSIWMRSDTYAHGFLILPISVWLVWIKRDQLAGIELMPSPWAVSLMVPPGIVWTLAQFVDVLVVQQLALVALLVIGTMAILGTRFAKEIAFPLFFLFFMVPMGDSLTVPMMEFTATSTIWLIKSTGIPVYREGLFFYLPSGNWSVVEACSGVRYVIASITLGVLYAYLSYRSFWRRALFILLSMIVPVLANSLRAYLIVMIGHISDMTLATGADHLFYGWLVFGFVMLVLFWLGSFLRESDENTNPPIVPSTTPASRAGSVKLLLTSVTAFVFAAIWPLISNHSLGSTGPSMPLAVVLPIAEDDWNSIESPQWGWQPGSATNGESSAFYANDERVVGLFIQFRNSDVQLEGDVVGSSKRFVQPGNSFRVIKRKKKKVEIDSFSFVVDEAEIKGPDGKILAWSWYLIDDYWTSNEYIAKIREVFGQFGRPPVGVSRIVVGIPVTESGFSEARRYLQQFIETHKGQFSQASGATDDQHR